jgi:ribA/ribD-fused uncharacterized protein
LAFEIKSFSGDYSFLSNFYVSPVTFEGETYPSVEHAFQAAKSLDPIIRERIRTATTPGIAKKLGRAIKHLRLDWEQVKLDVMLTLLRAKFQNVNLVRQLLATGGANLVEGNTWNDHFWGVCNGEGKNHLGRLLMQVRQETLVILGQAKERA